MRKSGSPSALSPAPMDDRNLILGVLAAQAGFVTPAQVMSAASTRMLARDGRSLLDHLVDSGALTPERRDLVTALANEALAANGGSPERVLESVDGARALSQTLGALDVDSEARAPSFEGAEVIPIEPEGKYSRLDELGRGGQSIVWRALDRFVGREVALKELASPGAEKSSGSTRAARARFLREARLTAQLDHPGVATILELARRPDGTLYTAQTLVRGRTLKAALAQCRTLSQRLELLPHLVNAAQTMAYAHARSVVHRDLKPSNVMVGPYGETVVVDWGLAKRRGDAEPASDTPTPDLGPELTQAGVALGTPSYMSPEQARGDLQAIDERSDVFSLGAMLYELLTGRPPFQGLDNEQVIEAVRSGHIVPVRTVCPEAPSELAAIADRALRRDPAERYPDAAAFASELLAYRAGARVEAYSYGSLELARKFVKRNRGLSAAIGASVLILIGGVVAVVLQLRQARVNLASALIERARRAEDVSDWARAAAYYAASRVQNDTAAARWGIALARERMPERGSALTGGPGAFTDVDVLSDGTVVALEARPNLARLYDVASGRSFWTAHMEEPIQSARITSGTVRLLSGHVVHILDEHTGQERFTSDTNLEKLCSNGPPTRRGRVDRPGVLHVEGVEGPPVEVAMRDACAISQDGARMAVRDLQGLVRLWDLDARREITSRPAPDAQDIIFTAHGVALVRSESLQLFGGPEGDFSVELPGRSASGFANAPAGRGLVVSADGHRVVVDSPALNRADVVDLRDRSVFVSVSRPPGDPRYAFSSDGSRLYAAGFSAGRALISWNLRRPDASTSGSADSRLYLRAGRDRFILFEVHRRVELHAEDGRLLRTLDVPGAMEATISWDGSTLAFSYPHEIVVQRANDGRELARASCELCLVLLLSESGARVAAFSRERRRVWDVDGPKLVRDEPLGGTSLSAWKTLSPLGDRMAWCENDGVGLEDLSTGSLSRIALPETPRATVISPDGTRLVVALPASFSVWKLPHLERVWTVPNPSSVPALLGWSADGSIVTVAYEGAGALLLDGRTGKALARIVEGRAGAGASQVNVLPSLRHRLSRGGRSWALTPMPGPDTTSPANSLRRVLAEGGFRLDGVDLEVVSP
ncbi:MAG TPA: WD40 repeat domain-containing serine/threonine protein kinase [Myxococcaceae bacterium]|nr:WD40 repeat domain-containing serine/threonine protein kinase [Myxococcaceae bacterium]